MAYTSNVNYSNYRPVSKMNPRLRQLAILLCGSTPRHDCFDICQCVIGKIIFFNRLSPFFKGPHFSGCLVFLIPRLRGIFFYFHHSGSLPSLGHGF